MSMSIGRLSCDSLAMQVVDFKREVYAEVAREFCPIIKRMSESSKIAS